MSVADIQIRLRPLFEENKRISALTTKLAKLSAPADGAVPEEGESRVELSAEIHQSLKDLEEDFEGLKQEADDLTATATATAARRRDPAKEQERVAVATQVGRLGEDIRLGRSQFRKAQLQAKRAEEAAKRRERERLFANVQDGSGRGAGRRKGQEKLSQDEQPGT